MRKISPTLIRKAAMLFGCPDDPQYLAGGHRWSDGTVYYHPACNLMLKIMEESGDSAFPAFSLRLQFARYLSERGINCLCPTLSIRQNPVERLDEDGHSYLCYAWPRIEGHTLQDLHPDALRPFYQAWGKTLGKCHKLAREYPIWHESSNPEAAAVCRAVEEHTLAAMNPDEQVRQSWHQIHRQLDARIADRHNHGFIHNDAHPQNIIQQGNTLSLLDFDVAGLHFFATDVAICIYSEYSRLGFHSKHKVARSNLQTLFLEPFVEAYLSEYSLPDSELKDMELFLNYRRMIMFTVFYDQIRKADPGYLEVFKREILTSEPFLKGIALG